MKRLATAALLAALSSTVLAAERAPGFYYTVEGGANFAQDIDITAAGFPTSAGFDAGYRFGAAVGYHLDPRLSVQFESGYLYNKAEQGQGSVSHLPFLVGGRWHQPLLAGLEASAGLGLGGMLNELELGSGSVSDSDGAVNVAWQASLGLSYSLAENMSVGLFYQYMGTPGTDYRLQGQDVETGASHNHSFGFSFHLDF